MMHGLMDFRTAVPDSQVAECRRWLYKRRIKCNVRANIALASPRYLCINLCSEPSWQDHVITRALKSYQFAFEGLSGGSANRLPTGNINGIQGLLQDHGGCTRRVSGRYQACLQKTGTEVSSGRKQGTAG